MGSRGTAAAMRSTRDTARTRRSNLSFRLPVRCDPAGIGKSSPISDPSRPSSDGLLDTSSESITSAGDEFDNVVSQVKA